MALIKVDLGAGLYIEADPDDPAVADLVEAVKKHATITASGVKVVFKDSPLYQALWDAMTEGHEIRFVVNTGTQESTVVTVGHPELPPRRNDAAIALVTRRVADGHMLFAKFSHGKALREFLRVLGVENVPMVASGLERAKKFGAGSDKKVWIANGAFDLTAFVELAESDGAGKFWADCDDARNVGPMRIAFMQQLAVILRQQQVVPLPPSD